VHGNNRGPAIRVTEKMMAAFDPQCAETGFSERANEF